MNPAAVPGPTPGHRNTTPAEPRNERKIEMDLLEMSNWEFVNDEPDVLARFKDPQSETEITFLLGDGATISDNEPYRVYRLGDHWFVVFNHPLVKAKSSRFVVDNGDDYGLAMAKFLQMSSIFQSALEEIIDRLERPGFWDL